MATFAAIGHGSVFAHGDGADPEVYTALAEVTNIEGPGISRDTVDATHMASPDRWREFIGGLRDAGEVTVGLNFVPGGTSHISLISGFNSDTPSNWKITFPDATAWIFVALCTSISPVDPLDDKMTLTAGFKLTGKPLFMA